jgi:hypothetical protein
MNEQSFSDFGTRSTFAPIQDEGKTFSLHGQKKTSLLLAANEAAFDSEYWYNSSHVAWSTVYKALYHSPYTAAKHVLHLLKYMNAELHLS